MMHKLKFQSFEIPFSIDGDSGFDYTERSKTRLEMSSRAQVKVLFLFPFHLIMNGFSLTFKVYFFFLKLFLRVNSGMTSPVKKINLKCKALAFQTQQSFHKTINDVCFVTSS
jgi:hypothetical protein